MGRWKRIWIFETLFVSRHHTNDSDSRVRAPQLPQNVIRQPDRSTASASSARWPGWRDRVAPRRSKPIGVGC